MSPLSCKFRRRARRECRRRSRFRRRRPTRSSLRRFALLSADTGTDPPRMQTKTGLSPPPPPPANRTCSTPIGCCFWTWRSSRRAKPCHSRSFGEMRFPASRAKPRGSCLGRRSMRSSACTSPSSRDGAWRLRPCKSPRRAACECRRRAPTGFCAWVAPGPGRYARPAYSAPNAETSPGQLSPSSRWRRGWRDRA